MTDQDFIKKHNADVAMGNVLAFYEGKRQVIGKYVNGSLVKLIPEDITPAAAAPKPKAPKKTARQKAKEEATDVVVDDTPVGEAKVGLGIDLDDL